MSSQARGSGELVGVSTGQYAPPHRIVVFSMADERYALPIECVQEVQQIVALSGVPSKGTGLIGMVDLRGKVIPAIDLRQMLGLPPAAYTLETPMVVCRVGGQTVALLVDGVEDVLGLPEESLQSPPTLHPLSLKLAGVARLDDGLVHLLDPDLLLEPMNGSR